SSSCLIPADSEGWLMLHDSAARPKCCSRASARTNSSLSIMTSTPVLSRPKANVARTLDTWESEKNCSIGASDHAIWNSYEYSCGGEGLFRAYIQDDTGSGAVM